MPLSIMLILVIGGITGIALMLHLLGYSTGLRFTDKGVVQQEWARHAPDSRVTGALISADKRAALVLTSHGPGLLWTMGADSTGHQVTGATVTTWAEGLDIDLHDFSAPGLRVRLAAEDRPRWQEILERTL